MNRLRKLFNIKSGEGLPVLILFAYFFFFGTTLQAAEFTAATVGGETNVQPEAGSIVEIDRQMYIWKHYISPANTIDLIDALGPLYRGDFDEPGVFSAGLRRSLPEAKLKAHPQKPRERG